MRTQIAYSYLTATPVNASPATWTCPPMRISNLDEFAHSAQSALSRPPISFSSLMAPVRLVHTSSRLR
ncbi:unnamed protein product [Nippostrongylus brasiliensis]|uniref:Uncharacterized protein n=1 Tax=Nippostrongylus brasiliensis TaxID=27835 RepID=A0A0N4YZU2_NIPBR|nr:unnamed protein product [Nippostrongylus brasiliensis]